VLLQMFTLWQFLRQWSIEAPSIQLNKP